jgi:hypothetical protein
MNFLFEINSAFDRIFCRVFLPRQKKMSPGKKNAVKNAKKKWCTAFFAGAPAKK